MKIRLVLLISLFAACSNFAFAADPLQVAPKMYKKLFENEKVRVMEVTFAPGQKIAEHSHPDHFVTVLEPGTLKVSKPDGSSQELNLKKEEVLWIPAETHWAQNVGKSEIKLLVSELKAHT